MFDKIKTGYSHGTTYLLYIQDMDRLSQGTALFLYNIWIGRVQPGYSSIYMIRIGRVKPGNNSVFIYGKACTTTVQQYSYIGYGYVGNNQGTLVDMDWQGTVRIQ